MANSNRWDKIAGTTFTRRRQVVHDKVIAVPKQKKNRLGMCFVSDMQAAMTFTISLV